MPAESSETDSGPPEAEEKTGISEASIREALARLPDRALGQDCEGSNDFR